MKKTLGTRTPVSSKRESKPKAASWDPIYALVKRVPRGSVVTYGEVARRLRLRGGARVAGYAMAACPRGRGIPWHRVVGVDGCIRLREPLAALQRKLLESEGVRFLQTRVDMANHSWKTALHAAGRKRSRSHAAR